MKICPTCRKTYTDDGLNFCLEDGSVLTIASNEPPETVMMRQPQPTNPTPGFGTTPQGGMQASWANQPQYSMQPQPKKSSKAWLWVVGVLGILLLLCGGGFAGLVYIGMQQTERERTNSNSWTNTADNRRGTNSSSTNSTSTTTTTNVEKIDLSEWVKDFSVWGTTEMSGDEFVMAAKEKGYYYVLVAPEDYSTDGVATKVSLRNVDNAASSLGYGLIFHSAPTPLTKDYAFLIDTKRKKYRVVRHDPSKETSVVPWTNSAAIKDGTQENILEARDKGATVELYINDQLVTSIKDEHGQPKGVPGLYSGDGVKIAFKNLEIRK